MGIDAAREVTGDVCVCGDVILAKTTQSPRSADTARHRWNTT